VLLLAVSRDRDDHRRLAAGHLSQSPRHLVAVHPGQADIQQDEVGPRESGGLDRLFPPGRLRSDAGFIRSIPGAEEWIGPTPGPRSRSTSDLRTAPVDGSSARQPGTLSERSRPFPRVPRSPETQELSHAPLSLNLGDLVAALVEGDLIHHGPDQREAPTADPHQVFHVEGPVQDRDARPSTRASTVAAVRAEGSPRSRPGAWRRPARSWAGDQRERLQGGRRPRGRPGAQDSGRGGPSAPYRVRRSTE
jgi:hypothetical protein